MGVVQAVRGRAARSSKGVSFIAVSVSISGALEGFQIGMVGEVV